ncbi:MAG: type II secretion system protein [Parcubacteria group bacterium]|nr:type II secretion system protein [Parcubacteria group bacterium]
MASTSRKGFTLVELLIVVSIIGLLSTLSFVALGSARVKARDAKRLSDVRNIQSALELYFSDNNAYPESDGVEVTIGAGTYKAMTNNGFKAAGDPATETVYMGNVPPNPTPGGADYKYKALNADRTQCPDNSATCAAYSISFSLEQGIPGLPKGAHTATPEGLN